MKAISLNSLILAFSKTFDLLDDTLHEHHWNVSYIGMEIAKSLVLPAINIENVILSGLVHDLGVFKLNDRKMLVGYEDIERADHEEIGALLLEETIVLEYLAPIVRYHHMYCQDITDAIPIESNILYLADRIAVLIDKNESPNDNYMRILNTVEQDREIKFYGKYIDAFREVGKNHDFWKIIFLSHQEILIRQNLTMDYMVDTCQEILDVGLLFITAVDFRSRFTAAHSYGVSEMAVCIGHYLKLSEEDIETLKIAGFYHDIGKIAVPKEILDKPNKLSEGERKVILNHSYYTHQILSSVEGMAHFAEIAAYHHEHVDGSGYPFGLKGEELSVLSRIVAVADVFTAITEVRPYRKSMEKNRAVDVLKRFAERKKLDFNITQVAIENFDALYDENIKVQNAAYHRFDLFEHKILKRTGALI